MNKPLIIIIVLAFIIRVLFFINAKPWNYGITSQETAKGDSYEYHYLAKLIVEGKSYPDNVYLDTYRTPIFPVYVSMFYFLFGIKPYLVLASHIILNLVSILFIFLICNKLFENVSISLIASLLFALEPNVIKLVTEFGTETLHATLFIASLYFFVAGLKNKKYIFIAVSGIIFGLTALTRPVSLYFYVFCILFVFLFPEVNKRMKIKYVLLFLIFYFISIAPWMFRNYKTYDHFSTNAFQGNTMLYNAGIIKAYSENMNVDSAHAMLLGNLKKECDEKNITNPFEVEKIKNKLGFNYIIIHLGVYSKLHLKGMLIFFASPLNNKKYGLLNKILISFYFFIIYSLCFYGGYLLYKSKNYYSLLLISLSIFYFCFLTGLLSVSRYRLPTTPLYLIVSAYGAYYLFNNIKSKFKKI